MYELTKNRYKKLLNELVENENQRMGYPTSMLASICYYGGKKIVDNQDIGIMPGGLAEKLLINVGDPFINPMTDKMHVKEFEKDAIRIIGKHLGLAEGDIQGYVTSGGTESNFASLWWSKMYLQKLNSKSVNDIKDQLCSRSISNKTRQRLEKILFSLNNPVLVCTAQHTHYSIKKIVSQLGLELTEIQPDSNGAMDCQSFYHKITAMLKENPYLQLIISANVGTTLYGAIDNIPLLNQFIKKAIDDTGARSHYTIHADAALLGIALPILKPFGTVENYFSSIGVNTIAISGHKLLGTSLPCGIVLTNQNFIRTAFLSENNSIEYIGNVDDITFSGCRSGLAILQLYNVIMSLDLDKNLNFFKKIITRALKNAQYFYNCLIAILGQKNVFYLPNQFNVVFKRPSDYIMKKYQLMPYGEKAIACILFHVDRTLIDKLITDIKKDLWLSL